MKPLQRLCDVSVSCYIIVVQTATVMSPSDALTCTPTGTFTSTDIIIMAHVILLYATDIIIMAHVILLHALLLEPDATILEPDLDLFLRQLEKGRDLDAAQS